MPAKWHLLAVLAGIYLMVAPQKSLADEFYTFVEINCDPSANLFEIKEIGLYNEDGKGLYHSRSKIDDPPDKSGTYSLNDLLTEVGEGDDAALVPTKTLRKTCKLSTGTFVAEIEASKGVSARGMCGAAEPDVVLSLQKKGLYFIHKMGFGDFCSSLVSNDIQSVMVRGATDEIVISATKGAISVQRMFPIKKITAITREKIFSNALTGNLNTDLLLAAEKGDIQSIHALLDKGANLESRSREGETALMIALAKGHAETVEAFLNRGADVNQKDNRSRTPLMIAVDNGNTRLVQLLIGKGANVNVTAQFGDTPLVIAARNRSEEVMRLLIKNGAKADFANSAALIKSAMAGYANSVEILLDAGAKVNDRDQYERTALSWAVIGGQYTAGRRREPGDHLKTVKMLLSKGADVNVIDKQGRSTLMLAVRNFEILKVLLSNGADVNYENIRNPIGRTPSGNLIGSTPLIEAIYHGNPETIKLLISRNITPAHWEKALYYAKNWGKREIVELLEQTTKTDTQ